MQALILAAGKGTRMRSKRPKVLHEILGWPVMQYVLDVLNQIGIKKPGVVVGSGGKQVCSFLREWGSHSIIWQREQRGTGHAVAMAKNIIKRQKEDLLIWPGDMPLLKRTTIENFIACHREAAADVSVLSALRIDPHGYGRILRAAGKFFAIREELDATESERRIQEVNTGIYLFKAGKLLQALEKIRPANQKKEFYLTDTIEILAQENARLEAFPLALEEEAQGINSRQDLADATKKMNQRQIQYHLDKGVTIVAPDQTFIEPGVKIGQDTVIYPWCYLESGVVVGRDCQIGPFAKIRKGSVIGAGSIIGSFVEVNRSRIGNKVLAKHLSYLGDAVIGDETNIGAGAITANFDGRQKHQTRIGKKVLVGSNTVFVAPVQVGDKAKTGAGSVVTAGKNVKAGQVVAGIPARPLASKKTAQKRSKA